MTALNSEAYIAMISGGCLDCSSRSQSKIFYIYELRVLQTGLRSWMDTCPLENLNNTFTFFV